MGGAPPPKSEAISGSTACIDWLDSYQINNFEEIHLSRFA
jgi:hypothetical protein